MQYQWTDFSSLEAYCAASMTFTLLNCTNKQKERRFHLILIDFIVFFSKRQGRFKDVRKGSSGSPFNETTEKKQTGKIKSFLNLLLVYHLPTTVSFFKGIKATFFDLCPLVNEESDQFQKKNVNMRI